MKQSINFKDIFLSSHDLDILIKASDGGVINIQHNFVDFLVDYEFISRYALSTNEYEFVITPLGLLYLNYLNNTELKNAKDEKRIKFIEIRSWLAVLISLIALIKSFLS